MAFAAFLATTVGKIVIGVVGLVLTAGIAGGTLYAIDFGVEATVVDKQCGGASSTVTVKEAFTGFEHTQPIGHTECLVVNEGNFVVYNIRSERTRVWDFQGGELLWDSTWVDDLEPGGPTGGGGIGGLL